MIKDDIQRELTRLIGLAEKADDKEVVVALLRAKLEIGKTTP